MIWYRMYPLQDGDDDNGNNNPGGDGEPNPDDKGTQDTAGTQRLEAVERAVSLLAQGHTELTSGMAQLISKLDNVGRGPEKKDDTPSDDDVDLETMDRKTYTTWLMGQIKGVLQNEVKPLNDRFSQLDEKIDGHTLGTMVERFVNDPKSPHPDFYEWKDEMRALVKENPTLTPARLYTLARTENRAKAEKLDQKYGLNKPEKRNGADNIPLSLFPRGGSATKSGTGKMSPKDAAEKAWNEVMSGLSSGG